MKNHKKVFSLWTSASTCGTVVYCKGGADMAQMSLEELCAEKVREKSTVSWEKL